MTDDTLRCVASLADVLAFVAEAGDACELELRPVPDSDDYELVVRATADLGPGHNLKLTL